MWEKYDPDEIIKRMTNERTELDSALNALYKALEYKYGNDITQNLQNIYEIAKGVINHE